MGTTRSELSILKLEFEQYKKESVGKITSMRESFKSSVENTSQPVSKYIENNRGSKSPLKKLKSYKLLKEVDGNLQTILKDVE